MTIQTQTGEGVARPGTRTKPYWAINDNLVLIGRQLQHLTRRPDQLFTALMLPATLLLFRFTSGGAIDVGNTCYVNYFVPGILVISVTMVAVSTSVAVQSDMQEGVVDLSHRTRAPARAAGRQHRLVRGDLVGRDPRRGGSGGHSALPPPVRVRAETRTDCRSHVSGWPSLKRVGFQPTSCLKSRK